MNGPNWNVFVTAPRFPAISYQVLCGRSRTSGRHSFAGGSLSLGMGSERNWLRSTSRFALSVLCLPWRMWSLSFLSPPAVAVSSPRNMDSASGTKSQKKLFLPKADFISVFSHRIRRATNTPSWSLQHMVWNSFRVIPTETQPHWRD